MVSGVVVPAPTLLPHVAALPSPTAAMPSPEETRTTSPPYITTIFATTLTPRLPTRVNVLFSGAGPGRPTRGEPVAHAPLRPAHHAGRPRTRMGRSRTPRPGPTSLGTDGRRGSVPHARPPRHPGRWADDPLRCSVGGLTRRPVRFLGLPRGRRAPRALGFSYTIL
eukprot:SAG11_NODE_507_length_8879_cov_8.961048_7_plen_166_part_00